MLLILWKPYSLLKIILGEGQSELPHTQISKEQEGNSVWTRIRNGYAEDFLPVFLHTKSSWLRAQICN
jgi:hypothetical protein